MNAKNNDRNYDNEVLNLVARHANCHRDQITLDTKIGEDLGIVGDDADELLGEFTSLFNLEFNEFDKYFPAEATANMHFYLAARSHNNSSNPILKCIRSLEAQFWKIFASKTMYETLTIRNLVNIIPKS